MTTSWLRFGAVGLLTLAFVLGIARAASMPTRLADPSHCAKLIMNFRDGYVNEAPTWDGSSADCYEDFVTCTSPDVCDLKYIGHLNTEDHDPVLNLPAYACLCNTAGGGLGGKCHGVLVGEPDNPTAYAELQCIGDCDLGSFCTYDQVGGSLTYGSAVCSCD